MPSPKHMTRPVVYNGLSVQAITGTGPEREGVEQILLNSGVFLPFPHRVEWARSRSQEDSVLFAIADRDGQYLGAFAVQIHRSRLLPGYLLWRCERFGASLAPRASAAGLAALAFLARRTPRILRVHLEVFSRQEAVRADVVQAAERHGFRSVQCQRCYSDTPVIELSQRSEAEIIAAFHKTARYNIRSASRYPVAVRTIDDHRFEARMEALRRETLARTGGLYEPSTWSEVIELGKKRPELSRLVGLFRTDINDDDSLLAFAWGHNHGDHVQYATAASTRNTDLRVSMAYPLVWDLIRWAKGMGAQYFDLGGISEGTVNSEDPLGGISDFKRYFSTEIVTVGAELLLEPRPLSAVLANGVRSGAELFTRMRTGTRALLAR